MKLINQNDYENVIYVTKTNKPDYVSGLSTTIKTSGCGICCGMMVAEYFGYELSLNDAIDLAYKSKANTGVGTKYKEYGNYLADKFDLDVTRSDKKQDLIDCLNNNGCVVINVGGDHDDHLGVFSHVGHYILAVGIEENTVKILDPGIDEGKYLEEGRINKVKFDDTYVYGDIEDIMNDVKNREYPFFMFYKRNKDRSIETVLNNINELEDEFVNIWKEVVLIDSPTSYKQGVDEVGKYFIDYAFRNLWDVDVLHNEVSGDAICITMNSDALGKPISISGHMDTVHPVGSVKTYIEDGKIYGPGCTDCKGGLIVCLLAMKALKNAGFTKRKIQLILQSDEEVGSRTSNHETIKWMVEKAKGSIAFLNTEMYNKDTAVLIRKGITRYDININGIPAHSSMCYEGKNAILEASHKIIELEKYKDKDGITMSCDMIDGGNAANTVAEKCKITVDVRFANDAQYKMANDYINKICSESYIGGTTCEIEHLGKREAMDFKEDNLRLLNKMNVIFKKHGFSELKYRKATGGSDAAYTSIAGIPTIDSIGVSGGYIHTPREYANIDSLVENASRMALTIYEIEE